MQVQATYSPAQSYRRSSHWKSGLTINEQIGLAGADHLMAFDGLSEAKG
jgi:hypothetical protein